MVRVGIGYDVHALVAGRPLVLGGVEIPHTHGLEGHSDADALMHAICDAVLGALGAGDIGQHFPNTDPRWKGVPSRIFLEEAARQVRQRGGRILNVDATVVAQQPRLAPHVTAMRTNIAAALGLSPGQVGVKATTNEGLGFLGRGEGIAALAVAAVELPVEGEQRGTSAGGVRRGRAPEPRRGHDRPRARVGGDAGGPAGAGGRG